MIEVGEIELREYIRTKNGYIIKYQDNVNTNIFSMDDDLYIENPLFPDEEKIVKHSKNIIDLIEVGDIVEIYDVLNEDIIYIWNEEMLKAVKEDVANGIKIRRILTKELFEANCYKVKEE